MFEGRLEKGILFKKCLDAIKDLVKQANFECTSTTLQLQALDTSHVAMIKLVLRSEGFDHFRCDRNVQLGMNTESMGKIFKCADNSDAITLRAEDGADVCSFVFESSKQDRVSDFGLKLMTIEEEQVSVPEMDYEAMVKLPSGEFQRICRDLSSIGETIDITVNKVGVHFATTGDLGTGKVTLKPTTADDGDNEITIEMEEAVSLRFAAKYLTSFTKATPLSGAVKLNLAADSPLMVDYTLGENLGHMQYYLAPKVDEDEDEDEEEQPAQADPEPQPAEEEEQAAPQQQQQQEQEEEEDEQPKKKKLKQAHTETKVEEIEEFDDE